MSKAEADGLRLFRDFARAEIRRLATLTGDSLLVEFAAGGGMSASEELALLKALQVKWSQKCPPRGNAEIGVAVSQFSAREREIFEKLGVDLGFAAELKAKEESHGTR